MPDPKKKKNKAPANASTDTGTGTKKKTTTPARASTDTGTGAYQHRPAARKTNQTQGTGVPQKRTYEKPYNAWATSNADGSAGQIYAYVEDDSFADGGPGTFKSLATASGGKGGRVDPYLRTHDPFLAGFNSDIDGIKERPTGRKRRK
jgi:hypothetical protein